MSFFRQYMFALIAAALLPWWQCRGASGLRIGDATGGSESSALRSALFELSRRPQEHQNEYSFRRMTPETAIAKLLNGEVDIIVIEKRDIPAKFNGIRIDFTAEALVLYSGMGNPLESLTIPQLKEIWQAERPAWKKYNGEFNDIHRLGLTMKGGGFTEARFLGGTLKREGIYRSGSIQRAWLFCSPAALLCAPATAERPGNIKIIRVNGVFPTRENIISGKYPLNLRYELLFRKEKSHRAEAFLQLLATPEYAAKIRESGLILNFTGEGKNEEKP